MKSIFDNTELNVGCIITMGSGNPCYSSAIMKLEAQLGQKSLTWIRLIMICYTVPWWPSWLSDQIAFRNPESDVV